MSVKLVMSQRTSLTTQRLSQVRRHFSTSVGIKQNQKVPARTIKSMEKGRGDHEKEKVVIVGTGWAGWTLSQDLNDRKYDITVISPERTQALTPLLASAACGIFDFRYGFLLFSSSSAEHHCFLTSPKGISNSNINPLLY